MAALVSLPVLCKKSLWLGSFFFMFLAGSAQLTSFNFHHLTTANGLSNSTIRSIAQDKYGFIWIGTLNGLNIFNGYSVKSFYKSEDPGGLPGLAVTALCKDNVGIMWVGTRLALSYFEYESGNFVRCTKDSIAINEIAIADKDHLWIVSNKGVYVLNIHTKQMVPFDQKAITKNRVTHLFQNSNGNIYFGTTKGLHVYNAGTGFYKEFYFSGLAGDSIVNSFVVDRNNDTWISVGSVDNRLIKLPADLQTVQVLPPIPRNPHNATPSSIAQILLDKAGKLWMTTSANGLVQFEPSTQEYISYSSDIALPNSIASDNVRCFFLDKDGGVWLGTEGYGVDWFYPQKNHFSSIQPTSSKSATLPGRWCRAATEDSAGNLWLATGAGLSCYNLTKRNFINYINEPGKKNPLHANSIRSLLTDKKGYVWIGTSDGINRFNPATRQFDFFDETSGIPKIFAWTLSLDSDGNIWAGGNYGIYRWNEAKNKFDDFTKDSLLGKFSRRVFRTMFQDSKGRFWFGVSGALMYDPFKKQIKHYLPDKDANSLIDENVFSFTEDREGVIWMGTMNGLSALDVEKNIFTNYTKANGLPSNEVSCLMVDYLGRLCMGTSNGLCFFDKRKKTFISFDINDGLCSNQINEQSAYRMRNGMFAYPTYNGFIVFKPEEIKAEKLDVPVFISDFKLLSASSRPMVNTEELHDLDLHYNQNFFNIRLVSPYYKNADHVWYAYKLDGFDVDWRYTQDPAITYTNVPGGNYVFLYKASNDPANWSVLPKTLSINIGTVYYKTFFFWLAIALFSLSGLFYFYRTRKKKKQLLFHLESKAQRLEKEKALMQYESLKQQLNPHFLFNSLTSLRSLIRIDPKQASGFLDQMSLSYRYILKSSEQELVPLQDELRFAAAYIELQKTRFCNGFQVSIDVDEYYHDKMIVPVTIQNLIENAIKHNIIDEEQPLQVRVFAQEDYLIVENNLQLKDFVETSNKQGLENIRSLYKYLDNRPMQVQEDENHFTVKIPLI